MVVWVVAWWCEKLQFKFAIRFRRRVGPSFTDASSCVAPTRHTAMKSGRERAKELNSSAAQLTPSKSKKAVAVKEESPTPTGGSEPEPRIVVSMSKGFLRGCSPPLPG